MRINVGRSAQDRYHTCILKKNQNDHRWISVTPKLCPPYNVFVPAISEFLTYLYPMRACYITVFRRSARFLASNREPVHVSLKISNHWTESIRVGFDLLLSE